jgi:hypothetical protein
MPTTTRGPRTGRIPSRGTAGQSTARFGRQASGRPSTGRSGTGRTGTGRASQRPSGRRSSENRRGIMSGKFGPIAKPAPKGIGKLTSKLPGVGGGKRRSSGSGAKAKGGIGAGVALLGAAAGVAFKNRDKLQGAVKNRGHDSETIAPASPAESSVTTHDSSLNGPAPIGGTTVDPDAPGMGGRTSPA